MANPGSTGACFLLIAQHLCDSLCSNSISAAKGNDAPENGASQPGRHPKFDHTWFQVTLSIDIGRGSQSPTPPRLQHPTQHQNSGRLEPAYPSPAQYVLVCALTVPNAGLPGLEPMKGQLSPAFYDTQWHIHHICGCRPPSLVNPRIARRSGFQQLEVCICARYHGTTLPIGARSEDYQNQLSAFYSLHRKTKRFPPNLCLGLLRCPHGTR